MCCLYHILFYAICFDLKVVYLREFEGEEEEEGNPLVVSLQDKDSLIKNRSKAWFSKVKNKFLKKCAFRYCDLSGSQSK